MSSKTNDDIYIDNINIELEDTVEDSTGAVVVVKSSTPAENESATPLEDRFGRGLWTSTRYCHCPDNALTDCRFHSEKEPGWETCPYSDITKKDRHSKGRQLWARNPDYGKPVAETKSTIEERDELPKEATS